MNKIITTAAIAGTMFLGVVAPAFAHGGANDEASPYFFCLADHLVTTEAACGAVRANYPAAWDKIIKYYDLVVVPQLAAK